MTYISFRIPHVILAALTPASLGSPPLGLCATVVCLLVSSGF